VPRATPSYPPEVKREAVRLVRSSPNRSVVHIAGELGVSDNSLRSWVKQTEIEQGEREGLATEECEELSKLSHPQRRPADRLGVHRLTYAERLDGGHVVEPGIEPLNLALTVLGESNRTKSRGILGARGGEPRAPKRPRRRCQTGY